MKLRSTIALGLAGLLIGVIGMGCPPRKPKPSERVYTNEQEILDRFVKNYGTGNVDVSGALSYNPLETLSGQLARTLEANSMQSLKATSEVYHIYVGKWNDTHGFPYFGMPENAINLEPAFKGAVNSGNLNGEQNGNQTAKYWLSNGFYGDNTANGYRFKVPTEIEGQGIETQMYACLIGEQRLDIKNIREVGSGIYLINPDTGKLEYIEGGGIIFLQDGSLSDSEIKSWGTIALNPNYSVIFTGNNFHDTDNPSFVPAIFFYDATPMIPGLNPNPNPLPSGVQSVSMKSNTFENLETAIYVTTGFQTGDVFAGGGNSFINVGAAIECEDGNTVDVDATGNYWAETTQN